MWSVVCVGSDCGSVNQVHDLLGSRTLTGYFMYACIMDICMYKGSFDNNIKCSLTVLQQWSSMVHSTHVTLFTPEEPVLHLQLILVTNQTILKSPSIIHYFRLTTRNSEYKILTGHPTSQSLPVWTTRGERQAGMESAYCYKTGCLDHGHMAWAKSKQRKELFFLL